MLRGGSCDLTQNPCNPCCSALVTELTVVGMIIPTIRLIGAPRCRNFINPKIVTLLKSNSKGLGWRFSKKSVVTRTIKRIFLAGEFETAITFGYHLQYTWIHFEIATCKALFLLRSPILARHRRERRTKAFRQGHNLVGEELLGLDPDTRRLALFELQERRQESLVECFACFSGEQ